MTIQDFMKRLSVNADINVVLGSYTDEEKIVFDRVASILGQLARIPYGIGYARKELLKGGITEISDKPNHEEAMGIITKINDTITSDPFMKQVHI